MSPGATLKLGLIGDNITQSRSPLLHRLAGEQNGIAVQYDRLIPRELGQDFDAVFDRCMDGGYRGINVTFPYKERVTSRIEIADPFVSAIGAVNTVLFEADGPMGHNTDYSGFIAAYRQGRGGVLPGTCCLIGSGGVGRALAFALSTLGADELRIVDFDRSKAEALADDLRGTATKTRLVVSDDAEAAADGSDGILNATPVGMVGHDGTPLPARAMVKATWAFDAVYTPVDTRFLRDAETAGLTAISGYELFFHQGVDAWAHFSGTPLNLSDLRARLAGIGAGV